MNPAMKVTHLLGPRRGMPACGAPTFDHVTELEQLVSCPPCKSVSVSAVAEAPAKVPAVQLPLPEIVAEPAAPPVVKAASPPPAPAGVQGNKAAPVAKDPPARLEATKPAAAKPKTKPKQRVTHGARGSRS